MSNRVSWKRAGLLKAVAAIAIAAAGIALVGSCARSPKGAAPQISSMEAVAQQALAMELDSLVEFVHRVLDATAQSIERQSGPNTRRAVYAWRQYVFRETRQALEEPNPRAGFLHILITLERLTRYFEDGDGRAMFEDRHDAALQVTRAMSSSADDLLRDMTAGSDEIEKIKKQVADFAARHPLVGMFEESPAESAGYLAGSRSLIGSIVNVPLAPVSAIQGVGQTPASISDIARSADRFSDVVEDLPSSLRWQMQLLAMNLEESPSVTATVDSVTKISASAEQFVAAYEDTPRRIRLELDELMNRLTADQEQWRETIREARLAMTAAESVTTQIITLNAGAQETLAGVRDTAASLERAAAGVAVAAGEIRKFIPADQMDESGQMLSRAARDEALEASGAAGVDRTPFSLRDINDSAKALDQAAVELRALVGEVRAMLESQALSRESAALEQSADRVIASAENRMGAIVDRLAWRGLQLVVLSFALALVLAVLLRRRGAHGRQPD